ncbi:MAG: glycosyltransferase family 61 protein [Thermoleophilia bacterium]|nr:glycosyltransferase family 61 protein [Thermoleophilia bacterium]
MSELRRRLGELRRHRRASGRRIVDSVAEFAAACGPGAQVIELPAPAPNAPPRPPQHLEPSLQPVLAELAEPWELRDVCVAVLPGAWLETPHGVVVARDGSVLAASAWSTENLVATGVLERRPRRKRALPGRHASLIAQFRGYFHWLTEALPRIAALRLVGLGDVPLIGPAAPTRLHHESLDLLGVTRWTPYRDGAAPDVLVWPRPVASTGHPPRWACLWLREQLAGGARPRGNGRLYISRRDAASRRVANEDEVLALLRREGFEAVQPERLSVAEQARLFAGADVVVAPHGAGNANVLFSDGATLIEIFEPGLVNGCYYTLSQALGHPYWYLMGGRVGSSDIHVPLDRLERVLAAALG